MSLGSDGKCVACHQSYFDATKGVCTVPTKLIDFVRIYETDTTVKECKDGYLKSSTSACAAISTASYPNCAKLNDAQNACDKCMAGYSLKTNTTTTPITITCEATAAANCSVENCQSCKNITNC